MDNKIVTVQQYVNTPEVTNRIQDLLKDRASDFIISVSSITNQNELLSKCDPKSLVMGALTATAMKLPINPNLGFCFLVPYKQKDGSYIAQLQLGYKSFVQLAMRSGQFKTINVSDVREGEIEEQDRLTGEIKFSWITKDRSIVPIIGYVAYIELNNGFSKSLYMTKSELISHGNKYSQSAKRGFGLWKDDFESMASKTVLKLLLSKYAPLTTDMQKAQLADQAVVRDDMDYEYVDNDETKLDPEAVSEAKEIERIKKFIESCQKKEDLQVNCGDYVKDLPEDNEIKKMYTSKLMILK